MIVLVIGGAIVLIVTALFVWALFWHLAYNEPGAPPPTPTVRHIDLRELEAKAKPVVSEKLPVTPRTSQLHIPPMHFASRTFRDSPTMLSGIGGSWTPLRKLIPRRLHRYLHYNS